MDIREVIEKAKVIEIEEQKKLDLIARCEAVLAKEADSSAVDWDLRYERQQKLNNAKGFQLSEIRTRLKDVLLPAYPEVWKLWFKIAAMKLPGEIAPEEDAAIEQLAVTVNEQALWISETLQRCMAAEDYERLEAEHLKPLFPRVETMEEVKDTLSAYKSTSAKAKSKKTLGVKPGNGQSGLLFRPIEVTVGVE
jgi:hypothetical protein